jgi:hypothetical protein
MPIRPDCQRWLSIFADFPYLFTPLLRFFSHSGFPLPPAHVEHAGLEEGNMLAQWLSEGMVEKFTGDLPPSLVQKME